MFFKRPRVGPRGDTDESGTPFGFLVGLFRLSESEIDESAKELWQVHRSEVWWVFV